MHRLLSIRPVPAVVAALLVAGDADYAIYRAFDASASLDAR